MVVAVVVLHQHGGMQRVFSVESGPVFRPTQRLLLGLFRRPGHSGGGARAAQARQDDQGAPDKEVILAFISFYRSKETSFSKRAIIAWRATTTPRRSSSGQRCKVLGLWCCFFFSQPSLISAYRANLIASLSLERRFCAVAEQAALALQQNPSSGPVRLLAARAARELGRFEEARAHIKEIFALKDPALSEQVRLSSFALLSSLWLVLLQGRARAAATARRGADGRSNGLAHWDAQLPRRGGSFYWSAAARQEQRRHSFCADGHAFQDGALRRGGARGRAGAGSRSRQGELCLCMLGKICSMVFVRTIGRMECVCR